ncbi:Uncharacterized protein OBRU01_06069 [Operophtera brumata]|uniref:Uncharacterized protein n=1 Tax=Operophtera brumata TaxID=104452 RepID=A0A0L7LF14_OPEBR|nr:Uncharacterized protein OBRU01_06069 [Operophtera brumata]
MHSCARRTVEQTARRRRGLANDIGYLADDLFRVLDSRFADHYVKDIETIHHTNHTNEKHLSNLWKYYTSIIEAEFKKK